MDKRKFPECVKLETTACPLGCQVEDEVLLTGSDRINGFPGEFRVVRCPECGFMWTNPRPTAESIGFYYPDHYGPYESTKVSRDNPKFPSKSWLRSWGHRIFETNTTRIPPLRPGRMLEIGCASGVFLHRMESMGWEVEGIEFSEQAADSARSLGYSVFNGTIEDAPERDKPYDLVVGWMVLEHLHEPLIALKKLNRWVKSRGWLVVSVPNAGAMEFKAFRERWYALHLPNHLYHFTPRTLNMLLERGGWKIVRILHQRTLGNLIPSIGYWLRDNKVMDGLSEKLIAYPERAVFTKFLLYPLACILGFLGETGRMTVWARKSG